MNSQDYFLLKSLSGWNDIEISEPVIAPAPDGAINSLLDVCGYLDGIETVTLDIFDTLLRRDVDPPEYVKQSAMHQLGLLLSRFDRRITPRKMLGLRDDAEASARQDALRYGNDTECKLSEIYIYLDKLLQQNFNFTVQNYLTHEQLAQFEVDLETRSLSLMPKAVALLKKLKQSEIKVILLSDMYLDKKYLDSILKEKGLLEIVDAVYVSSELRMTKSTGSLYQYLIDTGVIKPGKALHVGDNAGSDYFKPKEHGIKSLLFYHSDELKRRKKAATAIRVAKIFGDTSHLWKLSADRVLSKPSVFQIGYQRLGPVYTLFAFHVLTSVIQNNYRTVYFLARDSFLVRNLYKEMIRGLDICKLIQLPEDKYLYLSRTSTRLAELKDKPDELTALAQRVGRTNGIWAVISVLGFEKEDYSLLIEDIQNKKKVEDTGNLAEDYQTLMESEPFINKINLDIAEGTKRLEKYLTQECFFEPGKKLVVDIGWNGSILSTLEKSFSDHISSSDFNALFMGRLYGSELGKIKLFPGFAFDDRRSNPVEKLINECRELFEIVASSFEGSVTGYTEAGGTVVPKCAKTALSDEDKSLIEEIQNGVKAYCADFIDVYNRFSPNVDVMRVDAILNAVSLITGIRQEEQALIQDLQFDLGWGNENLVSLREYLGINPGKGQAPLSAVESELKINPDETAQNDQDFQKIFEKINGIIHRLKQENSLIFYGVGTVTSILAPQVLDNIAYFVDGNTAFHGDTYLGKPILSPDELLQEKCHLVFVSLIKRKNIISKRLDNCDLPVIYIDDLL